MLYLLWFICYSLSAVLFRWIQCFQDCLWKKYTWPLKLNQVYLIFNCCIDTFSYRFSNIVKIKDIYFYFEINTTYKWLVCSFHACLYYFLYLGNYFNSFLCENILTLMGLLLTDIFTQLKYKMQQRKGETKEIRNECKRNSEQNLLFSQIEIYLSSTDTTKLILGVKVKVRLRTKSNPPIISD